MRFVAVFLLALAVAHVAAAPLSSALEVCTATCADDDADARCAPACADCTCCTHAVSAVVAGASAGETRSTRGRRVALGAPPRAPAPEPRDVFHVPKPSFA